MLLVWALVMRTMKDIKLLYVRIMAYNDVAVVAGLHPVIDAPVKCVGVTNGVVRPADLLVDGDYNVRTCLDITVVSPFLASASRPFQVGIAAKDAETKKYKKKPRTM
jgi:hypothetical protein